MLASPFWGISKLLDLLSSKKFLNWVIYILVSCSQVIKDQEDHFRRFVFSLEISFKLSIKAL